MAGKKEIINSYELGFQKIITTIDNIVAGKKINFAIISALSVFEDYETLTENNIILKDKNLLALIEETEPNSDYTIIEINGRYISKAGIISESPGYFIIGMSKSAAIDIADKLSLESVIFNDELIYLNANKRETYDLKETVFGKEAIKEINYSTLRDNKAEHSFSLIKANTAGKVAVMMN